MPNGECRELTTKGAKNTKEKLNRSRFHTELTEPTEEETKKRSGRERRGISIKAHPSARGAEG
jgi:hypothetical protein